MKLAPILSADESKRFTELRTIIKTKQDAFWEFAEALAEVHAKKLWREKFTSFDEFCRVECGFTSRRARQLSKAADFREEQQTLAEQGKPAVVPETEREARQLMQEQQAPATPADLPDPQAAPVPEGTPAPPPSPIISLAFSPTAAAPPPTDDHETSGNDKMGYPLPKPISEQFNRWHEMQRLADQLSRIKLFVEESKAKRDQIYHQLPNSWLADMDNVIFAFKSAMPYAVCPYCQGLNFEQCSNCAHTGFVGKFFYERASTIELRKMRDLQIAALR